MHTKKTTIIFLRNELRKNAVEIRIALSEKLLSNKRPRYIYIYYHLPIGGGCQKFKKLIIKL